MMMGTLKSLVSPSSRDPRLMVSPMAVYSSRCSEPTVPTRHSPGGVAAPPARPPTAARPSGAAGGVAPPAASLRPGAGREARAQRLQALLELQRGAHRAQRVVG